VREKEGILTQIRLKLCMTAATAGNPSILTSRRNAGKMNKKPVYFSRILILKCGTIRD
jgi:hypothetical protein